MKKSFLIVLAVLLVAGLTSCSQDKLGEEMQTVNEFYKSKVLLQNVYYLQDDSYKENRAKTIAAVYLANDSQAVLSDSVSATDYNNGKWTDSDDDETKTFTGISFKASYKLYDKTSGKMIKEVKDEEFTINNGSYNRQSDSGVETKIITAEVNGEKYSVEYTYSSAEGYSKAVVNGKTVNLSLLNLALVDEESSGYYEYYAD